MQASISTIGGIVLGILLVRVLGRRIDPGAPRPSALAWSALGLGLLATAIVAMGLLGRGFGIPPTVGIAGGFASLAAAVGAFVKRDRHWPTWAALVAGGLPALFWAAFFIGELVYPH